MADQFELPEDVTALSNDDLDAALAGAVAAFEAKRSAASVTTRDMDEIRALAAGVAEIKAEKETRLEAAQAAASEIDALAAQVLGEDAEEDAEPEAVAETEAVEEEPVPEPVASAVVVRRPALDLTAVRRSQPKPVVSETKPGIEIVASVDLPGYRPGQDIGMSDITEGIMRRANALKTAGGGVGLVASYTLPFEKNMVVNDSSSAPEGSNAVVAAADQRRLPGGDLVASGGWCAPSETVYDLVDIACPEMLWQAPEIQLARGGIRFFRTPALDVNALTWIHTEADDIAGATKPCFKIPCPTPVEVRCEAIGICLEAGILTQRHFPELIAWYQRNTMVAHEIRVATAMYEAARTAATPVTTTASFATFSAVYAAVALQAADMIEKNHLCERIGLEVVFPWWLRNMFLADIARQQDVKASDLSATVIEDAFATLGVRVQFARGLTPDVPTNIGGPTAAVAWPVDVEFLIYPTGNFQIGRGAEVSLGVIHDSARFVTNDYTAAFSEECVALIDRGIDSRRVTVAVCASGEVGPRAAKICPVA